MNMDEKNKDKVNKLMHIHTGLLNAFSNYDVSYRELADYFLPTRYRNVAQSPSAYKDSPLLNNKLVDATGILAMRTLAAGLQGGMTSPARPWFQLAMEDEDLAAYSPVKNWLAECAKRMRNVFNRSNFYNTMHTFYGDLGTFGTGFMLELADFEYGFRFMPFAAGSYVLDTNAKDKVDVVYRRFQMSARQMAQRFGINKLPSYVKSFVEQKGTKYSYDERFTVVHAIYPRKDYKLKDGNELPQEMRFASVYYLDSVSGERSGAYSGSGGGHLLSESGFHEFPGFGVRWQVEDTDVYGISPAMEALPDCRMLQQMGVNLLKAIHKMVDPPTSVSASLKATGLDLTPGGVNYVETMPGQSPQAATPIFQMRPEIQAAGAQIKEVQNQVKQGLYNDLFRLLMDTNRRMITAKEVATREEEKLILIGPVIERMHSELFNPLIERTFQSMLRMDMLPPPPQDLDLEAEIKVEFVSLLAQAQKLVGTSAIERVVTMQTTLAPMYPEVLDAVNPDKATDIYADYMGVDPSILRPQSERDEIRKQRAEAQQAAQQAEMQAAQQAQAMQSLQGAASTAHDLASTPLNQNSALDALIGGMGGM